MGAFEEDLESMLGANDASTPQAHRAHALVVAGMHRTGTSAMTRVLGLLGIDLPRHPVPGVPNNNDLGFWESVPISQAHDRFLESIGSSWDDVSPISASVFASPNADAFAAELAELVTAEYGDSSLFVVKDPRLCRLLPIWSAALERVGARPSFVITTRNPLEVAASLKERDGFTATKSCILWLRHLLDAERGSRGFPRVFVSYEQLLRDWVGTTDRVARELRLFWPRTDHDAHLQIDDFLSTALRHHAFDYSELRARSDVTDWVKQAYDSVARATTDAGELDSELFDEIGAQLDRADQAYGPLLAQARATIADTDAELADVQAQLERATAQHREASLEAERLSIVITERDEQLSALHAELDEVRAESGRLSTAVESAEGAFVAAQRRLEGAVGASAKTEETLRAELAAREEALRIAVADREQIETVAAARLSAIEGATEALAADLESARAERDRVAQEALRLAGAISELEDLVSELHGVLAERDSSLAEALAQVAGAEEAAALQKGVLEQTVAEREQLRAHLAERESAFEQTVAEREQLRAHLAEREGAFEQTVAEGEQLRAHLAERESALEQTVAEGEQLRAHLAERESAFEQTVVERDRLTSQVAEREGLLEQTAAEREEVRSRLAERESLLAHLRTERDQWAAEGVHLGGLLAEREQELERMRTDSEQLAAAAEEREGALEQLRAESLALVETIAEHERALQRSKHDYEVLQAESRELGSALAEREEALAVTSAQLSAAEARLADVEAAVQEAVEAGDAAEAEQRRLSGVLAEREEVVRQLRGALAERQAELADAVSRLEDAERQAEQYKADLEQLLGDHKSALAERDAELAAVASRLENAEREAEEQKAELERELDLQQTALADQEAELAAALAASQEADRLARKREAELERARTDHERQQAENARLAAIVAEGEIALATLRSEHESLRADAIAQAGELIDVSGQLTTAEAAAASQSEQLQEMRRELDGWLIELERLSDELTQRDIQLADALTALDAVKDERREWVEELDDARASYDALRTEAGELAKLIAMQQAELADSHLRLEAVRIETEATASELRAGLAARDDALAEMQARLETAQAEAQSLLVESQSEIVQLTYALQEREERLVQMHGEKEELVSALGEREGALTRTLEDARILAAALAETEETLAGRSAEIAARDEMLYGARSELEARDELLNRRWQQLDRLSADLRARDETLALNSDVLARLDAIGRARGRRWRSFTQFFSWLMRPTAAHRSYIKAYLQLRHAEQFDTDFYLSRYPDVAHLGLNPLMHYIEHGQREGRQPAGSPLQLRQPETWTAAFSHAAQEDISDVFPQALPSALSGVAPQDADLVVRMWHELHGHVPESSVVAVATGGDERLLEQAGCATCHFPRASDGGYGGHDIAGETALIANLEASRAAGADFLLVPISQRSILDRNPRFRAHVFNRYWRALDSADVGICFALFSIDSSQEWRRELADLADWIDRDTGREASILDWESGLALAEELPHCGVFSVSDAVLPHVDDSVDVVAVVTSSESRLAEAARVARHAVLEVPDDGSPARLVASASFVENAPTVSIVIPCHEEFTHTETCVRALGETLPAWFRGEIMIVDDASSPATFADLQGLAATDSRVKLLRNETNVGFLGSANRAVTEAIGEFVVLLNNDTIPLPGWLTPLLGILRARDDVGEAGGKLVYPNGRLQEAGGLVFRDGSAAKFGYHDPDPDFPLFDVPREVDYCSGCLLAFRRDFFLESGAFDPEYGFGFYEDTDYCFRVRSLGKVVWYEPESVIVHVEGASAGIDLTQGAKRFQALNASLFMERWREALARQPERPVELDREALQLLMKREPTAEMQ